MPLTDPQAFQMAGLDENDMEDVLGDLDYLHLNSTWPYSRERTREMVMESPDILREFLRSVRREALRSAMIPRKVKELT